jgi:hypothetical protein
VIRPPRWLVMTWGALVLPLFVCAHDGEALMARLTLRADGGCALQVTADLEGNFRIRDRAGLAEAAAGLFQVSTGLTTTATKLEPDTPFPHTAEELAKTYRLERAEWRWTPDPRNFVLSLPAESPHTVLLWLVDETKPDAKPRWVMLIAGDESPLIQAHAPAEPTGLLLGGAGLLALIGLTFGLVRRHRRARGNP